MPLTLAELRKAARVAATSNLQDRVVHLDNARHHGGLRPPGVRLDLVVWHATAGDTLAGAWSWLNRVLKSGESPGSYTYGIEKNGTIHRTLPVSVTPYHAGRSAWPVPLGGVPRYASVNTRSIGVAFANDNGSDDNPHDDSLTYEQALSGLWLGRVLTLQYGIPLDRHRGHREVAPGRKTDPVPACVDMNDWRVALAWCVAYHRA